MSLCDIFIIIFEFVHSFFVEMADRATNLFVICAIMGFLTITIFASLLVAVLLMVFRGGSDASIKTLYHRPRACAAYIFNLSYTESIASETEAIEAAHEEELGRIRTTLYHTNHKFERLEKKLAESRENDSKQRKRIENLIAQRAEQENRLAKLELDDAHSQAVLHDADKRICRYEEEVQELRTTIDALKSGEWKTAELQKQKAENDRVEQQSAAALAARDRAVYAEQQAKAKIAELETENRELVSTKDTLETRVQKYESDCANLSAHSRKLEREVAILSEELASPTGKLWYWSFPGEHTQFCRMINYDWILKELATVVECGEDDLSLILSRVRLMKQALLSRKKEVEAAQETHKELLTIYGEANAFSRLVAQSLGCEETKEAIVNAIQMYRNAATNADNAHGAVPGAANDAAIAQENDRLKSWIRMAASFVDLDVDKVNLDTIASSLKELRKKHDELVESGKTLSENLGKKNSQNIKLKEWIRGAARVVSKNVNVDSLDNIAGALNDLQKRAQDEGKAKDEALQAIHGLKDDLEQLRQENGNLQNWVKQVAVWVDKDAGKDNLDTIADSLKELRKGFFTAVGRADALSGVAAPVQQPPQAAAHSPTVPPGKQQPEGAVTPAVLPPPCGPADEQPALPPSTPTPSAPVTGESFTFTHALQLALPAAAEAPPAASEPTQPQGAAPTKKGPRLIIHPPFVPFAPTSSQQMAKQARDAVKKLDKTRPGKASSSSEKK